MPKDGKTSFYLTAGHKKKAKAGQTEFIPSQQRAKICPKGN